MIRILLLFIFLSLSANIFSQNIASTPYPRYHKKQAIYSSNDYEIIDMVVDPDDGAKYILGHFIGNIAFNNNSILNPGGSEQKIFLVKYNANNNVEWMQYTYSSNNSEATDLLLDKKNGRVFVSGVFEGTIYVNKADPGNTKTEDAPSGHTDYFIVAYDISNGNWKGSDSGDNQNNGTNNQSDMRINSIVLDTAGIDEEMYAVGTFKGEDMLVEGNNIGESDSLNLFIMKFEIQNSSSLVQLKEFNRLYGDGNAIPKKIVLDTAGNPIVIGHYTDIICTGGSCGSNIISNGKEDGFIVKYSNDLSSLQRLIGYGSVENDRATDLVLKEDSNSFIMVGYNESNVDFVLGSIGHSNSNSYDKDMHLAEFKFSSSTDTSQITEKYAQILAFDANQGDETPTSIVLDTAGNPIIIGTFTDTLDFNKDTLVNEQMTTVPRNFILGLVRDQNDTLAYSWAASLSQTSSDLPPNVMAISSFNNSHQLVLAQNIVLDTAGMDIDPSFNEVIVLDTAGYVVDFNLHSSCFNSELNVIPPSNPNQSDAQIIFDANHGLNAFDFELMDENQNLVTNVGLIAGTYYGISRDATNCISTDTITICGWALDSILSSNPKCAGDSSGNANLDIINYSSSGFNINWINIDTIGTGTSISNIPSGNYNISISDSTNRCAIDTSIFLSSPSPISSSIFVVNETIPGSQDGYAVISATGGTPSYTFSWSGLINDTLNGIGAGTYLVSVTDSNECIHIDSAIVETSFNCTINLDSSLISNETINGSNNGSISIAYSGGQGPVSINWSNGSQTNFIDSLQPGNFSLLLTDSLGCTLTDTFYVAAGLSCQLTIDSSNVNDESIIGSQNGSIMLYYSGGYGTTSISWNNGLNSNFIDSLAPGYFAFTLIDSLGCNLTDSIYVDSGGVCQVSGITNHTNASGNGINDGVAQIIPQNGFAPYQYYWSNGRTTDIIDSLSQGNYFVTVIDNFGCEFVNLVQISTLGCNLIISGNVNDESAQFANDGSISINVQNNTSGLSFIWSNGNNQNSITGLSSGMYVVTVSDSLGCSLVDSFYVNPYNCTMSANLISQNISSPQNHDGSIESQIIGGTAPYNYTWSNGSSDSIIVNLCPGSYSVTIMDANNCYATSSGLITLNGCNLNSSFDITYASQGNNDGQIVANVVGGNPPYQYSWSNGYSSNINDNLSEGIYVLEIIDSAGCLNIDTLQIGLCNLSIDFASSNETTENAGDGWIQVYHYQGHGQVTYMWSHSTTNTDYIDNLNPGSYVVTVTDIFNCKAIDTVIIEPALSIFETDEFNAEIYPIPVHESLFINSNAQITKIEILDGKGAKLTESPIQNVGLNQIKFTSYAKGIYYVKISSKSGIITRKITKI
jgi:hypothetical protein